MSFEKIVQKKHRCEGCGAPGPGTPTIIGREDTGKLTDRGHGCTVEPTWVYAWMCEPCRAPYLLKYPIVPMR